MAVAGGLAPKLGVKEEDLFWQIDPTVCTQCGRCETHCVLPVSAVKCIHAHRVCGYCDLCGGYYRTNVKELNTAAENLMCPTGAIQRKFVEDPYFEYMIDEELCNGCGKCVKVCPLNNFSLKDGRPIWGNDCTHCMACIGNCPTEAIEYGNITQTKEKYRFQKYAYVVQQETK